MPYLTLIGPQGVARSNLSGVASKGYWVFRRGSCVVTRWGRVHIDPSHAYVVRWHGVWQEKTFRLRTVTAARRRIAKILHDFQLSGHGYQLMPRGVRIHPARSG